MTNHDLIGIIATFIGLGLAGWALATIAEDSERYGRRQS